MLPRRNEKPVISLGYHGRLTSLTLFLSYSIVYSISFVYSCVWLCRVRFCKMGVNLW